MGTKWAQPIMDRFIDRIIVGFDSGCWEWTGAKLPNGYGVIYKDGRNHGAHRVAYELFRGEIPKSLVIDHLCRNHGCVNPWHVEPVTNKINIARGIAPSAVSNQTNVCIKGLHSLDDAYVKKDGRRQCRKCHRLDEKKRSSDRRNEK